MANMQIQSVLSQIRALSSQVQGAHGSPLSGIADAIGGAKPGQAAAPTTFANVLRQAVDQTNESQMRADKMATDFQKGVPGVELGDVMLEMQKASISFRAVTEVRNRLVSAYQEIMNMPI